MAKMKVCLQDFLPVHYMIYRLHHYFVFFRYIGYLAGIFYRRYEGTEIIFPLIIVSAGDLIYEFFSYIGNFLLHNRLNIVFFLTRFIIPEMIYTMLAFVILYKPLVWLNSHLNVRDKRRVNKFDERNI